MARATGLPKGRRACGRGSHGGGSVLRGPHPNTHFVPLAALFALFTHPGIFQLLGFPFLVSPPGAWDPPPTRAAPLSLCSLCPCESCERWVRVLKLLLCPFLSCRCPVFHLKGLETPPPPRWSLGYPRVFFGGEGVGWGCWCRPVPSHSLCFPPARSWGFGSNSLPIAGSVGGAGGRRGQRPFALPPRALPPARMGLLGPAGGGPAPRPPLGATPLGAQGRQVSDGDAVGRCGGGTGRGGGGLLWCGRRGSDGFEVGVWKLEPATEGDWVLGGIGVAFGEGPAGGAASGCGGCHCQVVGGGWRLGEAFSR